MIQKALGEVSACAKCFKEHVTASLEAYLPYRLSLLKSL